MVHGTVFYSGELTVDELASLMVDERVDETVELMVSRWAMFN